MSTTISVVLYAKTSEDNFVCFHLCNQKGVIAFRNKDIGPKVGNILLVSGNEGLNFLFVGTFSSYLNSILALYIRQLRRY